MTEFAAAFAVSLILGRLFAGLAPALGLIDHPGGHRDHKVSTPLVGGLAMYLSFLFVSLFFVDYSAYRGLLIGGGLLVIVGALDDRFELATSLRFVAQILAAMAIVYFDEVQLIDLGSLFSDQVLALGRWSVFMTIFAVVGVINAINMSDGIDGLAGSLVCVTLGFLALLTSGNGYPGLIGILLGAIAGFLFWNLRIRRPRALIFMGDAGSMFLGLCVAWLLISGSQGDARVYSPVTALWLLALPLWDAVAALLVRPLLGVSPFTADRFHYHHVLLARGYDVNRTLALSIGCAIGMGMVGTVAWWYRLPEYRMFYCYLAVFLAYCVLVYFNRRKESAVD